MFRELVKAILKYDSDQSVLSYHLIDTLKRDIRQDAIQAFEQSQSLIEKHPHIFQSSNSFVDFLFRICGVQTPAPPTQSNDTYSLKEEIRHLKNQLEKAKKEPSGEEDDLIAKLKQSHQKEIYSLKEELDQVKNKCKREQDSLQRKLEDQLFNLEKCEKELRECRKKLHQAQLECTSLQEQLTNVEQNTHKVKREVEKWKNIADQSKEDKSLAISVRDTDRMTLKNTIFQMQNTIQQYERTFMQLRHSHELLKRRGLFNYPQINTDSIYQSFMSHLYSQPSDMPSPIVQAPNIAQLPPIAQPLPLPEAIDLEASSSVLALPNLLTSTNEDVLMRDEDSQKKTLTYENCIDKWKQKVQKLQSKLDVMKQQQQQVVVNHLAKIKQLVHNLHDIYSSKLYHLSKKIELFIL